MASQPRSAPGRLTLLDGLRAVAALSVLGSHVVLGGGLLGGSNRLDTWAIKDLLWLAEQGVAIFFVLSGFVLYRPFVAARRRGRPRPATGPYAVRRLLRIVPAYWLALTVAVVVAGPGRVIDPGGPLPYYGFAQTYSRSTITHGLPQAWTLGAELVFYALLPLWALAVGAVVRRAPRRWLTVELGALAALALASIGWKIGVVATLAGAADARIPALLTLPAYLDHFAAGMALAVVGVAVAARPQRPAALRALDRRPWLPWLAALAGAAVLLRISAGSVDPVTGGYVVHRVLETLVAALLLIPAVLAPTGVVRRALGPPVLLWLGLVSYGLYLWHVPVTAGLLWIDADRIGIAPFALLATLLTVLLAAASWYGLERHAIALGHRVGRRPTEPERPAPPELAPAVVE